MRFVPAACVYALAAATHGAPMPDLSPKFVTGDASRYVFSEEMTQSTFGKDQDTPATTKSSSTTLEFRLQCLKHEVGKGGEFKLVYDSIKMSAETPMGPMSYDSTRPDAPDNESMLGPAYQPLIGVWITIKVDPAGRITSAAPEKAIARSAARAAARFADVNGLNLSLAPLFGLRPPEASAESTKWTTTSTMALGPGATATIKDEYVVGDVKDGRASISSTGSIDTPPPTGAPIQDAKMTIERMGTYVWSVGDGALSSSSRTETTTLTGKVAEGPLKSVTKKTEKLERQPAKLEPTSLSK